LSDLSYTQGKGTSELNPIHPPLLLKKTRR
jgi:hypothetical protein